MRNKLLFFSLVILTFFLAAAFRLVTSNRLIRSNRDLGYRTTPYRTAIDRSVISCRVLSPDQPELTDIPPLTGWGHHRWKITTTSDSAQFYFDQGINMYYAFHTLEARASFTKAIRFDTACAMAWYGKALALGPTINFGNGFRAEYAAWEAAQTGKKLGTSCTPLEKDLINAITRRYSADTTADLSGLQVNYSAAMKSLAETYSRNADVVALYADALMLEHPWDLYDTALQPRPWTPEIRRTLEKALAIDSRHPGALHFMIHTVEGSLHPEDGINSAETLAGLMPDVAHVVHMPSHIYIRTGYYRKGIDVNDHAVSGYHKYVNLYQPVTEGAGLYEYHAVHMKMTCAMMAGNYKDAIGSSDTLRLIITPADLHAPGAWGNFGQFVYDSRLFTLLRFGKWEKILEEPKSDSLAPYANVLNHFARGMALAHLSRLPEAQQELQLLQKGMQAPVLKLPNDPFSSAYDASLIAEAILSGVLEEQQHHYPAAREAFQKAVAAEDRLIYDEPRDWLLPARQYLGDLLLKMEDYKEAIQVFDRDLQINPLNGWSLTGLRIAYQALNDKHALQRVNASLAIAWQIRDYPVNRPVY